jgi:Fe-S oxidoreductase
MTEQFRIYSKDAYHIPLSKGQKPPAELALDNYLTFACRHKFCLEVCPVYQVTRNEAHTSYGFHTSLFSIWKGIGNIEELGGTFTHCLQCGACEVRCPNTLFMGDFYKVTQTTIELVRKVRSDLVRAGVGFPGLDEVKKEVESHLQAISKRDDLMKWTEGLDVQVGGRRDLVLYVSRFTATQATETARAAAKLLKKAGLNFSVIDMPQAGIGEALDIAREDKFVELARKDVDKLREMGAEMVVVVDPHDYFFFQRIFTRIFGELPFKVVFITDVLWQMMEEGRLVAQNEIHKRVIYHDPCTLNKLTNVWESPRKILSKIPGVQFTDEHHIDQWYYCCGNGVSTFKKVNPEIAFTIGQRRIRRALDLGGKTLALGCPHCGDHLTEVKTKTRSDIELINVIEILAQSVGV